MQVTVFWASAGWLIVSAAPMMIVYFFITSFQPPRAPHHEHPSFAYVETDTTLKALAMVAARIAFETNIADTAAKGATFAEKHAEMVGQTLEALRKSGDQHPFARVRGASRWQGAAKEESMTELGTAVDPQERA